MKILIDDQYHSDENNDYEDGQYTADENGNLDLFIEVNEEMEKSEPMNTINRDNIYKKEIQEEIIESDFSESISDNKNYIENYDSIYSEIENNLQENFNNYSLPEEKGTIEITSKLGSKEGVELKGARINLYLLNGVSPKLYDSKFTDSSGKAIFNNLENGCYRVIAIVDRRFFEKPCYYEWNEVTIDKNNKYSDICVVNKIKMAYYRR